MTVTIQMRKATTLMITPMSKMRAVMTAAGRGATKAHGAVKRSLTGEMSDDSKMLRVTSKVSCVAITGVRS